MLDFVCIGAQKAGTSWLYSQLQRHPGVGFPHGKEVHYWDWVEAKKRPEDVAWYRRKFESKPGLVFGDMTPAYATLSAASVRALQSEYPAVQVLFLLRNPIERAWSAAKMAMEFSQLRADEATVDWFRVHVNSEGSRARGSYEETIRRWRTVFPTEQFHVRFYDDIRSQPRELMVGVARILRIDDRIYRECSSAQFARRYNESMTMELPNVLKKELVKFYKPRVESLSDYLQMDLSHWLS